ncbi:MAG: MarR family transcriptional regulator [Rubrivivax sp.]|nr:MAG: MarR family transcriptional regulator [Rubrivivax sp.]
MFDHCMYFNTTALARQLEREWALAFKPFDLTPPQAFMLRAVIEQPGMLQHQLASLLDIARPTATRALDGLEAKQLLERRSVKADGREQAIHPTDQAVAMKKDLNQASAAVTSRLKKKLGADGFSTTVESVKGVRSALK